MSVKQRTSRPDVFLSVNEYNAIALALDALVLAGRSIRTLQGAPDSTAFTVADKSADQLLQVERGLKALQRRSTVSG
jgi:hypothetical protein